MFVCTAILLTHHRGGRGDFKWEDVKQNAHRENYLGHSVMARKSSQPDRILEYG
jgi:hypothetical protein